MNEPPKESESEKESEESSFEPLANFPEGDALNGFIQVYKKLKLMVLGDPVTLNSSDKKNQELNFFINAPEAKQDSNHHQKNLEKINNEHLSESVLTLWRKNSTFSKENHQEKLTKIYDINKSAKKDEPKPK